MTKKHLFIIASTALLALTGCNKNEGVTVRVGFQANFGASAGMTPSMKAISKKKALMSLIRTPLGLTLPPRFFPVSKTSYS